MYDVQKANQQGRTGAGCFLLLLLLSKKETKNQDNFFLFSLIRRVNGRIKVI